MLLLMYELLQLGRDLKALDEHVEAPQQSPIFQRYPLILASPRVLAFIVDNFRLMALGRITAHELEGVLEQELDAIHRDLEQPSKSLRKTGEAMPGFGIVAAVLGVVMAMSIVAVAGLFFFFRGMEGNRLLRRASLEEDPMTRTELIERAEGRLMVRDAAQRELAYQLIRMAVDEKRGELLGEGLTRLHQHFRQEPHARDLGRLLAWYSDVRETDLLESVARYLKPGAYSIVDGQLLLSSEDYRYFFGSE